MRNFACLKKLGRFQIGLLLLIAGPILIACGDETSGPTTDPNAQLVLLEPGGGETFHIGDSLHVRWKAQGKGLTEISSVLISISLDSGATWASLKNRSIGTTEPEWSDYAWKIPATLSVAGVALDVAGRSKVLIRVQDYQDLSDANKRMVTPKTFSILP